METTTPACVAIDLDLAYDIWSLLFCCIRTHFADFSNADYTKIFFKPIS